MTRPNFFIVGGPKCGTTALYEYLRLHPQVFMSELKEPNYFGRRTLSGRQLTEEAYLKLFRDAGDARFVGEASPLTLVCETSAREIHEFSPDARIIAMVRNPVEMLYAMYTQCLLNSDEDIDDFAEALAAEADRSRGERIPSICGDTARLLYRRCARFTEQLERFFTEFGRDRVHVIVFDSFRTDTAAAYRETLAFLDADPFDLPDYPRINEAKRLRNPLLGRLSKRFQKTSAVRRVGAWMSADTRERLAGVYSGIERRMNRTPYRRPPLSPEMEASLRAEFAPEIENLGKLLDCDLSHWIRPETAP